LRLADRGFYDVVVSNSTSSVTSDAISHTVVTPGSRQQDLNSEGWADVLLENTKIR
jgi:hypothetical protein